MHNISRQKVPLLQKKNLGREGGSPKHSASNTSQTSVKPKIKLKVGKRLNVINKTIDQDSSSFVSLLTNRESESQHLLREADDSSVAISSFSKEPSDRMEGTKEKTREEVADFFKNQRTNGIKLNTKEEKSNKQPRFKLKKEKGKVVLSKKMLNLEYGLEPKKSLNSKPFKKLSTQKDLNLEGLSLSNQKEQSDKSYACTELSRCPPKKIAYELENDNYQTEGSKIFQSSIKRGSHQNSLEHTLKFEKGKINNKNIKVKSKGDLHEALPSNMTQSKILFNSSANYNKSNQNFNTTSKKLNIDSALFDVSEDQSSEFNNVNTNSARQNLESSKEHNKSLNCQLKNRASEYIKCGELQKLASHNKSSNLAFSMLDKSELLEDRQTQVSHNKPEAASSLSRGSINSRKSAQTANGTKKPKKTWPMKPGYVLNTYKEVLTEYEKSEILDYREIYFVGPNAKKVDAMPWKEHNQGYDDERGDYNIKIDDHIGYRYEIKEMLGKGSFGQAYKCWDHKDKEYVALKVLRNKKKLRYQANVEIQILSHLKEQDPDDNNNIIRIKESFNFRNHL